MLDALFRRGNPTNLWHRSSGLALSVDLLSASINSVPVGSPIETFSFLGRSSSKIKTPLDFDDLGISLDYEDDGTVSGFQVILVDSDKEFSKYSGVIKLNDSPINPLELLAGLGEPYWRDQDEEEILVFYEYSTHEIQIEQSLAGECQRIIVTKHPLMGRAEQREAYGVEKPWPPY